MAKPNEWNVDVTKIAKALELGVTEAVYQILFELCSRVIKRTPVRHGVLRRNWRTTINSISSSFDGKARMAKQVGSLSGAELSALITVLDKFKMGDYLALVNNTPYGPVIERGRIGPPYLLSDPTSGGPPDAAAARVAAGPKSQRGPRNKPPRASGSPQAPEGMLRKSIDELRGIVTKEIAKRGRRGLGLRRS